MYAAVVLAAAFGPPIAFTLLVALAGGGALAELWAIRRAGVAALAQLAVLLLSLIHI